MSKTIKETIITDYTAIALYAAQQGANAQRDTICKPIYDPIDADYKQKAGYIDEVNLGLGCGFPFDHATIKEGDVVVDLGCGAGIDTFITATRVGESGKVIGIDLTEKLLQYAAYFAKKKGIGNVAFQQADMERIPLKENCVDVVLSNGVFSLTSDLDKVLSEIYRILKPGGTLSFSDMTCKGSFTKPVLNNMIYFTGCLNGISTQESYLQALQKAGFQSIELVEQRIIPIPADIIETSPDPDEYKELQDGTRCFIVSTITCKK